ncbi:hypothetical protein HKD37_05G012461 [Glycine soja]
MKLGWFSATLLPSVILWLYGYGVKPRSLHFGVRLWFLVRDFCSSVVEELAGLCNFMARIPDKIRSIDGSKETLKLAVRITDLWFVGTPNKSEQAEKVFVDSEGDQIHAICKSDHLKSWKVDLKENCTYVMHNFKVVKNDGQFRVCEHKYKFVFYWSDDIIGVVDQVVFRHVSSKNTRVVFRIKDLSGEILSCTLWENYCIQFLSYLNEHGDDGPMVIILTHARIKDAQGSYPASVSNSFKASKLLINDPILEIQEFKERLLDLGVEVSPVLLPGDQASSQVSGGSQLSSKDSFLSKAEIKTIFEINGISESWITIHDVIQLVFNVIGELTSKQDHSHADVARIMINLYRVEIMVTKNNKSSKFLLWDHECVELIGETADDVNRVKIEDGDLDLNASPQALDKLLGHVLGFKVRIQSKFKNAVVLRYSNDLDLINVVLEMLSDSEILPMLIAIMLRMLNVLCFMQQSPSVTADHDPVAELPLTPKKRMSSDEVDDELGSSQISPTQLSINRKRIMQQKRHGHAQSSSQPTVNCTSEYNMIASDSSESEDFESTQGTEKNNYQHAKRCDSTKARINRKCIMQQKRHGHAQSSSQPTVNCTSEYNMIVSDSSESENSESTQGYSDLGDQLIQCRYCNAQMWYDERISKNKNCQNPRFSLCCGDDKVELPLLQNPPQYLQQLLFHDDTIDSKNYQHNLRAYNMMFAFTSARIKLDKTINNSRGPLTIRIQGQPCHRIGSLLPMPGKNPKFAQLYIFDTENEVQNRINVMSQYFGIHNHIISALSHMLDQHNSHAKSFRMTRDRLAGDQANNIKLQLIAAQGKDGRVYNMPNVPEIDALIIGDFHPGSKRDIIVETQNGELQRIHELHPSYLPLQYPLLFPYGEDRYRTDILHRCTSSSKKRKRNRYTMVESERLSYIRNNQKKLRVDKYSSLQTSLDTGTAKGLTKGKRVILPSTLLSPLNLKPTDRPDIVSRIFILKYEHMLLDLTKGQLLGKVVAYMHTIEFQKRGLPHINDDTLRNLTLIEIEQLLHINQRSLKDYPTMPYPEDINLTSYLQNNLMNKKQFITELSKLSTTMKGQLLSMVGLYLPKPVFTHGQLYVALSRVNSAKGLKILIHDDQQKSMNSTTNVVYKEVFRNIKKKPKMSISSSTASTRKYPHFTMNNGHPITHKRFGSNTMEQPTQYESNNTEADIFLQMDSQTKNAPHLQWDVVTLDRDIKDKSIVRLWYKLLRENDFHHGDEVSFYYRPHERIWEIVLRRERRWQ